MICKECSKDFKEKTSNQVYCSAKCRDKFWGRKYYLKNKDVILSKLKTPENRAKERFLNKQPHRKAQRNEYLRNKRKEDPLFKIEHSIKDRIRISNYRGSVRGLQDMLGYSYEDLKNKLIESPEELEKFLSGDLVIDHIIPHSLFYIFEIGDDEFMKCWDIDNLRLLKRNLNSKKSAKVDFELINKLGISHLFPKSAKEVYDVIYN